MKKKTLSIAIAAMVLLSGGFVASCKKKDTATTPTTTPDTSSGTAADNNSAENHSNDAEQIGAESIDNGSLTTVARLGSGSGMISPLSGSITITPSAGNILVTFNNYVGMDGHYRNGSILYSYSGGTHYRDPGMTIVVTTPSANPYMVDSNTVNINKTIINNGISNGTMSWAITSTVTITKPSGAGSFTWTGNRTKTLLNTAAITWNGNSYAAAYNGTSAPISWGSALIGITGSASGSSTDGKSYTANINSQLVRDFNCSPSSLHTHFHPFIAGEIDFTPAGKTTRQINYGTGACDETYTITIGSWSTTLTMNR